MTREYVLAAGGFEDSTPATPARSQWFGVEFGLLDGSEPHAAELFSEGHS